MSTSVGYAYDVFVSYRRHPEWTPWVRSKFAHLLETHLIELRGKAAVFTDERLSEGGDWDRELRLQLARSRLLVPVLSPPFFLSEWCRRELAIIREREQRVGLRTAANHNGLIFPAIRQDGDRFPLVIRAIQSTCSLHSFALVSLERGVPLFTDFEQAIEVFARKLSAALDSVVPDYDPAWETLTGDGFMSDLVLLDARQSRVTRLL